MENNYASFAKHNGNLMRISSSDEFFKNELILTLNQARRSGTVALLCLIDEHNV